jgi:hypothetical protein
MHLVEFGTRHSKPAAPLRRSLIATRNAAKAAFIAKVKEGLAALHVGK